MSSALLDVGATIICPHGGRASPTSENSRVLVNGTPALLVSDSFPIAGCPFLGQLPDGTGPQPCIQTVWSAPAARVLVDGRPVLVSTSAGQCLNSEHIPQGPPVLSGVQPRVIGR